MVIPIDIEIEVEGKETFDLALDLSKKINKEIMEKYEYPEEIAKVLGLLFGIYVETKDFEVLAKFFIEGFKKVIKFESKMTFIRDVRTMKDYVLEEHNPNFNALVRVLLEQIEKDLIINYVEK